MVTDKITPRENPFGDVFPINSLPAARLVEAGIDRIVTDADTKFEASQRFYERGDAEILFFFSEIANHVQAMGAQVSMSADAMPCIAAPARIIQSPSPVQTFLKLPFFPISLSTIGSLRTYDSVHPRSSQGPPQPSGPRRSENRIEF